MRGEKRRQGKRRGEERRERGAQQGKNRENAVCHISDIVIILSNLWRSAVQSRAAQHRAEEHSTEQHGGKHN